LIEEKKIKIGWERLWEADFKETVKTWRGLTSRTDKKADFSLGLNKIQKIRSGLLLSR